MLSDAPLTEADLYEIIQAADAGQDPDPLIARLLNAADQGNLADKSGIGHAYTMAAQLTVNTGDLQAAEAIFDRALAAYQAHGIEDDHARAFRAAVLLRQGREDEGMAELSALRPRLLEDPAAAEYLPASLADGGQLKVAEQWLTEAVKTAVDRRNGLVDQPDSEDFDEATMLAFGLLQARHEIRHELDLPHDEHDDLAEALAAAFDSALHDGDEAPEGVLFWPRAEFDQLLQRWPAMEDEYEADWDDHRAGVEEGMAHWSEVGAGPPKLVVGSIEGLIRYAGVREPTDPEVLDGYESELASTGPALHWPPRRNDACWCGSGQKYKKCCLPRAEA